jgi:elongation factor Ts
MQSHGHKRQASPSSGGVTSYLHAGGKIGVLVEVSCESDFVARNDDFRELIHDIAMHIAATDPKFIRKEHVAPQVLEHERNTYRTQAAGAGKPPHVIEQIVEGKTNKFYEQVCLYEQPFIKDQTISISQLIASRAGKLGEEIAVRRFARFKVEGSDNTIADDSDGRPEGDDETGVTANKPKGPKAGSGFAAAKPDLV